MAGIRLVDKWLTKQAERLGTAYPICSQFAICSFDRTGRSASVRSGDVLVSKVPGNRNIGPSGSFSVGAAGVTVGWRTMDRTDPDKHPGKEARDAKQVFCPKCALELRLMIDVLDSRTGEIYRLFRCNCGELVWGN